MRVTNMAGVDLDFYRFDFDLTFAALLMNADGTIYHTYGGRDWTGPMSQLSVPTFTRVLKETLKDHAAHGKAPAPKSRPRKRFTIERYPKWAREIKRGKRRDCYHCHMVNEARIEDLRERRRWSLDKVWTWPDPAQLGLTLEDQLRVKEVAAGSPAAAAGLRAKDRLRTLGSPRGRLLTFGDVQRVLENAPAKATRLVATWERGGVPHSGTIRLRKGWKAASARVFAWRPSKWALVPAPGFGGSPLGAAQKEQLGLPEDRFAFRVDYLVTWGKSAHVGQSAIQAGIRKGDVVFSVAGRDDFNDMHHFHAWFRLTRKAGRRIPVKLIRGGKRMTIQLEVVE